MKCEVETGEWGVGSGMREVCIVMWAVPSVECGECGV